MPLTNGTGRRGGQARTGVVENPQFERARDPGSGSGGSGGSGGGGGGGGGNLGNVPSGTDVRNENAPQVDELRSRIDDLRQRLNRLQQRPTQEELNQAQNQAEQVRENAERAVQVAYRLGIKRAVQAIRQRT